MTYPLDWWLSCNTFHWKCCLQSELSSNLLLPSTRGLRLPLWPIPVLQVTEEERGERNGFSQGSSFVHKSLRTGCTHSSKKAELLLMPRNVSKRFMPGRVWLLVFQDLGMVFLWTINWVWCARHNFIQTSTRRWHYSFCSMLFLSAMLFARRDCVKARGVVYFPFKCRCSKWLAEQSHYQYMRVGSCIWVPTPECSKRLCQGI